MEAAHTVPLNEEETTLIKPRIEANPWIILIVLALGEFMILLDTTIVSVALPKLSSDLGASLDQVLWVINAYTLVFAILLITAGRLGDMFGSKRMFLSGLALFTAASAACGLSQTPNQLILFRVIQAVGGAILMPQTLSIITSIFPPGKRGGAFGAWSSIAGLAAAGGPTLGGALVSAFSWRAVFFPNVPIGAAALILALLIMPEITFKRRRRLDLGGTLLATGGLLALIYGVIEGQKYNWGRVAGPTGGFDLGPLHVSLISIPTILALSVILLIAFVLYEARQEEPLLPLSLFRERNYSIGNLVAVSINFGILGLFLPLTIFLQSVLGLSAFEAGIAVVPLALASALTAPLSGRLTDRLNGKYLLFAGLLIFSSGLYLIGHQASLSGGGSTFTIPLIVAGLGMGLTLAPMTALAMRLIAPSAAGAASGFINTMRQVGSALGSAVVGAVLATQLSSELKSQAIKYSAQLPAQYRASFVHSVTSMSTGGLAVGVGQAKAKLPPGVSASLGHQITALGTTVFNQAFLNALRPSEWVTIPLLAIAALFVLFMRTPKVAAVGAIVPATAEAEAAAPAHIPLFAPIFLTDTIVLPMLSNTRTAAARSARPIRAPFLARVGEGAHTEYPLRGTVTIGRLPSNDIVLDDPKASRRHTELFLLDGQPMIRDLQSANGTMLNGETITGDRPLHDGDIMTIGDTPFAFHNDIEVARPRLVAAGDGAGAEHPLTGTLTIGRASSNDIVLNDPKVSRRHAEIDVENGQVVVRDLESLNGTRVNGQSIVGTYALSEGDAIAVGETSFVYHNDFASVPA